MALTQVKTSGIADDAVTLAKQAGGTDGNLITYNASGNPDVVATGNSGQVLTSNGSGAAPTFQAASGGISDIVSDTSPQLGGDLDVQTHAIKTSTTNGDIAIYTENDVILRDTDSTGTLLAKFEHGKWTGDAGSGELKITGTSDGEDIIIQGGNANKGYIKVWGDAGSDTNIHLVPAGAGVVVATTHQIIVGESGTAKEIISTGAGTFSLKSESNADISITPDGTGDVTLDADTVRVGDSNADVAITTNGTGDLTLSTNAGTNSGTIEIEDGANNDIVVTPNGSGDVIIDGLKYPQADGSAGQVLKTDGSAQLSWTTPASGKINAYQVTKLETDGSLTNPGNTQTEIPQTEVSYTPTTAASFLIVRCHTAIDVRPHNMDNGGEEFYPRPGMCMKEINGSAVTLSSNTLARLNLYGHAEHRPSDTEGIRMSFPCSFVGRISVNGEGWSSGAIKFCVTMESGWNYPLFCQVNDWSSTVWEITEYTV